MQRRHAATVDMLAQEVSRLLAAIDNAAALEDPQGLLLQLAAAVETEWEGRARRFRIDRSTDATPAPSAPASDPIRTAVLALQPQQRELLLLHLDGLTYRQIAVTTALPKEVVLEGLASAYCQLRWRIPDGVLDDMMEDMEA